MLLTSGASKHPEKRTENTQPLPPAATEGPERRLKEHLAALGSGPRAELLHVLTLPDFERAERIDGYYGDAHSRTLARLLIEVEGLPHARAAVLDELLGVGRG